MEYRCEATSVAGFVQQLAVAYVGRGYLFYVKGEIVVLVNSDRIDRLGVVAHPSFLFWTRFRGLTRVSRSLISDPLRPAVRDPRLAPSDRCPPALGQAPQTDRRGPLSLDVAVLGLERLGIGRLHRQAGHGDWLAA